MFCHGSYETATCMKCKTEYDLDDIKVINSRYIKQLLYINYF